MSSSKRPSEAELWKFVNRIADSTDEECIRDPIVPLSVTVAWAALTPSTRPRHLVIASKSRIGRVRLAARRGFIVSDGHPITIRQVLERAYPRLRRFVSWHYLAARRALRKEAIVIARNRFGRGRPNLWTPKSMRHDATWN